MNVARLITLTKRKNEILSDFCDKSTLFLCLCETFLHEGILDSEIKISGFSIIRCDRSSRTMWCVCGAVEEMMCVVCVDVTEGA